MMKTVWVYLLVSAFMVLPEAVFAGDDYLQAGYFKKSSNAVKFVNHLRALTDQPSGVITQVHSKKPRYWVIIEGFKNRKEAKVTQKVLAEKGLATELKRHSAEQKKLFRWANAPILEEARVLTANEKLVKAIKNPKYLFAHDLRMPAAPEVKSRKEYKLGLREVLLLSLRYNPNIQSSELERITQRFELRKAENVFEWQFALTGGANYSTTKSMDIRRPFVNTLNFNPNASIQSAIGSKFTVAMTNAYDGGFYNPTLDFKYETPLLRGLGSTVTQIPLKNAIDQEEINILTLRGSIIDKITTLISSYRAIIGQNNRLVTKKRSLKDAEKTFRDNEKKIKAGTLEPTGNIQQAVQVEGLKLELIGQTNDLIVSKRNLLQSIGLDPEMNIVLPSDVEIKDLSIPSVQETVNYALANNISYQQALIQYRSIQRELVIAENEQLWQLDLSANTTLGSTSGRGLDGSLVGLFNGRNVLNSVSLNFSVPINELDRQGRLISAKVALEKARIALIAQRRQLIIDVKNKITDIKSVIQQYELNKRKLLLNQRSYALEKKKVSAGIATTLDLNQTQNQLIDAENLLIDSKTTILNKRSELEQILGTTLDVWKIKLRYS